MLIDPVDLRRVGRIVQPVVVKPERGVGRSRLRGGSSALPANLAIRLAFEGANGASGAGAFTDTGPYGLVPTVGGTSPTITTGTVLVGTSSGRFPQAGELFYNHADLAFGTGDFTIRGKFRFNTVGSGRGFLQAGLSSAAYSTNGAGNLSIYVASGSNKLTLWMLNGSAIDSTVTASAGVTYDIEINRLSGGVALFVDGVQRTLNAGLYARQADTTNYTGQHLALGGYYSSAYRGDFWVDDFEIYKGRALHTSNFTPS